MHCQVVKSTDSSFRLAHILATPSRSVTLGKLLNAGFSSLNSKMEIIIGLTSQVVARAELMYLAFA